MTNKIIKKGNACFNENHGNCSWELCECKCHVSEVRTGYFEEVKGGTCFKCGKSYIGHYNEHKCEEVLQVIDETCKRELIKKAKDLLPDYIDQNFPKVEHSDECFELQHRNGNEFCIDTCPREGYDNSRGRATVDIINYLNHLEKKL